MQRILVTGAGGFVGTYLVNHLTKIGFKIIATGRGEADPSLRYEYYLEKDLLQPAAIEQLFHSSPEMVIHCAALSKPDDCEQNNDAAFAANVTITENLLIEAGKRKLPFLFLSTDFVFDGLTGMYVEDDERDPVNYYGYTKMMAEDIVASYKYPWSIVRTVLVYGRPLSSRHNLVSSVAAALSKGERLRIFDDQMRTPTYVGDLVKGIGSLVERTKTGIYHLSGAEKLTPYDMACRTADFLGYDRLLIEPIKEGDLPSHAKRPLITGLNIRKAEIELGYKPLSFEEGLAKTFSSKQTF